MSPLRPSFLRAPVDMTLCVGVSSGVQVWPALRDCFVALVPRAPRKDAHLISNYRDKCRSLLAPRNDVTFHPSPFTIHFTFAPMSKIKVLHIIKSLGRGGAEMLLPETLALHNKEQFEFHYIYFLPWKNQMVDAILQQGGKVACFAATNNLKIVLQAGNVADYVRNNGIQLIHCHLPWAGVVGRLAGKMAKVPVIYTEHNKWERYHKLTFLLNKLTFPMQKLVVAVSQDVADSITKFYKKPVPQVAVVLNGVNTAKFVKEGDYGRNIREELNIRHGKKVIGIISVFRFQKRLKLWLDLAKAIHERNPGTHFIIIGDGILKDEVHAHAKQLGTADYVHFAGLQTEVRPYLQAMDVFMMSSEFEGLPIALLEAMSMECIPACTDAGGIKQVITDGVDGIMVPVEEPLKLVDRMLELFAWPEEKQQAMARKSREKVMDLFSLKRMVAELEERYMGSSLR